MSDIAELQKRVAEVSQTLTRNSEDPKVILLFLLEELGEVVRAYLKEEGEKPDNQQVFETYQQELGDVFFLLLRLANVGSIDLEKELERTLSKLQDRTKTAS